MMEKRSKYNGLNGLLAVLGHLLLGARAQQTEVKLVGSEVTMVPIYNGNPIEINWKKDGNKLVDMEVNPPSDPIVYRLRDRATIDRTNGRLTIKGLTIEDSGLYRAEVLVNNVYQYTEIRLTVRAQQEEIQWVGSEVTLVPRYTKDLKEIIWKKNNIIVVEMKLNSPGELIFDLPRDRATIYVSNGALTIKNLNTNDSGNYTAEALLKNNTFDKTEIMLTVRAQQVEEKWVGSDVILKPQYIGVPAQMIWRKGNQIVVRINLIPQEEITFYPLLEDRATINRTNGALTIENLTIEDSGPYKAEVVSVNAILYYTNINLTVYAQQVEEKLVGDYVILKPQYIGVPSEITWRKGNQEVVHMRLIPQEKIIFPLPDGRATIDGTNGALTIKDLTIGDSGPYKAEVVSVDGISYYTKINLNLRAQQQEIQLVGRDVILVPQYTEALKEIIWRRNNTIVVEIKLNPLEEFTFKLPRERVTVCTNGALTIKNLNINDSGNYTSEALLEDGTDDKTEITVTVYEYSCAYNKISFAIVALLFTNITAVVVFWALCDKSRFPGEFIMVLVMAFYPPLLVFLVIFSSALWSCYKPSGPSEKDIYYTLILSWIHIGLVIIITLWRCCFNNQSVMDFVQGVCFPSCKGNSADKENQPLLVLLQKCASITVKFQTDDQPNGIVKSRLTIHNVKPEDRGQYTLEVQSDIKEMHDVIIKTKDDRVTLNVPEKVTTITWKKNRVTLFEWNFPALTLHTNNITLKSGFVTVNDAERKVLYEVGVHQTTNNTLQLEADNQGNESSTNEQSEQMVPLTNNGLPESQAIVTFHPVNMTNDNITWKKDDQPMNINDDRIKSDPCGDLTINNVTSDDKGTYTVQCEGQDQEQEFILL